MNAGSIQGFVNLDKPRGWSSRRATELVARAFGRVEAGHAGTLDPLAGGVLPVALGGATKLVELLHDADKEYRARVRLGLYTDTDDAEGQPLGEPRAVSVTREQVEAALAGFRGAVMQRPPAFSALKREGRAAYESARAGRPLELAPRPVTFHELSLLAFEPPEFEVFARVSRGTYLRALARDLGEALLCGGHLAALVRTRVGAFRLENVVSPEHLGELSAAGRAAEALIPARRAFPEMAMLVAADEQTRREVMWARPLPVERFALDGQPPAAGQSCLILDPEGRALFLAEMAADEGGTLLVRPRKKLG